MNATGGTDVDVLSWMNNNQQLSTTAPVSLHFNQAGHSINDVRRGAWEGGGGFWTP